VAGANIIGAERAIPTMSDPMARQQTWKPKSAQIGEDGDGGLSSLASKFGEVKLPVGAKQGASSPQVALKVQKMVRTSDLAHNNVFLAQKMVIAAEEDVVDRMKAEGKSAAEFVHESQKVVDEGAEDQIPEWRAQEIKEMQAEKNSTFDLPEREAARVRKRNLEKKKAERAIKAKIAAGLVELDGITGLAEEDTEEP